jgi:hypothetical protein
MSDPKAQLSALQNDPDAAIEALNERYALCVLGGKPAVLVEKDDGVTFWSQAAFFAMLAGTAVYNGEKNVNLARWWWRHPGARRYEDVTFDPAGATEGTFNLWRGFSVGPRAGDCGRFLDHIHQVVCAADDDLYAWVMGWFAQIIQEPSTKIGTAVAFRGAPGSGKTIVGEMIGSLFVKNYMLVDNPSLVAGRFNGHLANLLLLHR